MFLRKHILSALTLVALSTTALTPLVLVDKSFAGEQKTATVPAGWITFAQDHSDLKPDPLARFGRLSNGLTYIIYPNATPPGVVSLRMRFAAGSLMESEQQLGLAHFLEHMAFNGSKNVPEGEMVKILERHGLRFGPDTNAYTSWNETVYMLDLPKNNDEIIDTGLFLFRETAGNLNLDSKSIDKERGVILGEERARATPGLRSFIDWNAKAFPNQLFGKRSPIGAVDIISNAKRDEFVKFYNDFYRPELTTIIVAGDVNPDAIEAKIKAKFADLLPRSKRPLDTLSYGTYTPQPPTAYTYTEKGLSKSLSVNYLAPFEDAYETDAKDFDENLDSVVQAILNQRLERLAKSSQTAFAAAGSDKNTVILTGEVTSLNITPKPGQEKAAFEQSLTALRQLETYGATDDEVSRVLNENSAGLEAAAKGEKTRNTSSIVTGFVGTIANKRVMTSPSQDLEQWKRFKPRLTTAAINERAKTLFSGDGPFISHTGEEVASFDKALMLSTYKDMRTKAVEKPQAVVKKAWPYTEFGKASEPVKTTILNDIGVTQLSYANGTKVNIKPTQFKDNEIVISAQLKGGMLTIPASEATRLAMANWSGLFDGGLSKLEAEDIKNTLQGRIFGASFGIGDDATSLSGGTTPEDFELQMQVLAAFVTDAAVRPEVLDRVKSFLPNYYNTLPTNPDSVFAQKGRSLLRSGDPRFALPDLNEALALDNEGQVALVKRILSQSPIEITIVGNISVDQAKTVLNKTFGALPKRSDVVTPAKGADKVKFPTKDLHQILTHKGRDDQNLSYVAWPTTDFFANTNKSRATELLAAIMTLRLTDEIREKQGASYGSTASSSMSSAFTGFGFIISNAGVKPEADQTFYDSVMKIAEDLKARPVSPDELLRARKPILDRYEVSIKTNGYWASALPGIARDPRNLSAIRSRKAQLEAISPKDIQAVAKAWLIKDKALRIQVKPEPKP
jgi:zinc protease